MSLSKNDLLKFMQEELGIDTANVDAGTSLFSAGIIDSFALVSLITFIEERCSLRMQPTDVTVDNMDSVDRILAYVERTATTSG
jgi:acyl carrier protein